MLWVHAHTNAFVKSPPKKLPVSLTKTKPTSKLIMIAGLSKPRSTPHTIVLTTWLKNALSLRPTTSCVPLCPFRCELQSYFQRCNSLPFYLRKALQPQDKYKCRTTLTHSRVCRGMSPAEAHQARGGSGCGRSERIARAARCICLKHKYANIFV